MARTIQATAQAKGKALEVLWISPTAFTTAEQNPTNFHLLYVPGRGIVAKPLRMIATPSGELRIKWVALDDVPVDQDDMGVYRVDALVPVVRRADWEQARREGRR